MSRNYLRYILLFIVPAIPLYGSTIHVPSDFPKIQLAIDVAVTGDTVLVDRGRYYENINFKGKKIVLASHYLLSSDIQDIDSTIIDGSQPANPDTSSVVLFISGEDASSVLAGFTITGGNGTKWKDEHGPGTYREGGGILCAFTSPTIQNNVIVRNNATDFAGLTSAGGGGMRCGDGDPRILNNVIMYNQGRYGGGIVLNYCAATIKNNVIFRNSGGQDFGGGGIWINQNGTGVKVIENNTIYENSATVDGGGIYIDATAFVARNNIIWGNSASSTPQISAPNTPQFTYCDIQGGRAGLGNINADPKFIDTSCYLNPSSPAIDAGDPNSLYNDPEDPLHPGNALWPSLGGIRNDVGAFGGPGRLATVYFDLHLDDPLPPSSIIAYSDYQTQTSLNISWHDPVMRRNGQPLSAFTIHIYRDGVLIASVDSGVQMFNDSNLVQHQHYGYRLLTSVSNDSSVVDSAGAFAGGSAQPMPPTLFSVYDRSDGILLQWTNPRRQIDNTPLNDMRSIMIYRDGTLADSMLQTPADTGQERSYLDTARGYHYYRLRVEDDETPVHYSASTDSLLGFGHLENNFNDGFEHGIGEGMATGSWDTTSERAYSGKYCLTDSPGRNYSPDSTSLFLLPPVILNDKKVLEYHDIAIVRQYSFAILEISSNQRKSFTIIKSFDWTLHSQWSDGSADSADWVMERYDLSSYLGDTVTIGFKLITSAMPPADGWYIDSVRIEPAVSVITEESINSQGWNLLSLPLQVGNGDRSTVFPHSLPEAFAYHGSYMTEDSLRVGNGYWVKFGSPDTVQMIGNVLNADTIDVAQGWNLVGSTSFDIDSSSVKTMPAGMIGSSFYGYDGQYQATRSLQSGRGYWVKTNQPGKMILSSFNLSPGIRPVSPPGVQRNEDINTLQFTDNTGHHATLFFSEMPVAENRLQEYDAPPLPPGKAFDIRFSTNTFIASPTRSGEQEFPLQMQSVSYPLTLAWTAQQMTGRAASLQIGNSRHIDLSSNGKITIQTENNVVLHVVENEHTIPASFDLDQNYPNPFNPSTTIGYQLPEESMVTLKIYSLLGQEIATLVDGVEAAGFKVVQWDGTNMSGSLVSSGVYWYQMKFVSQKESGKSSTLTKKLLIAR